MHKSLVSFARKGKFLIASAFVALTVTSAGAASFALPGTAQAASCDKVNIVYCGLEGNDTASYISSFKGAYSGNNNNGHTDLRAVYAWAGLSAADASAMNTTNTKLGTLYRDGRVVVNGQTVATNSYVTARFTEGAGFTQISNGVWARSTTTSFAEATAPVLVQFNADGTADSAIMIGCGNAVKFTPVPKPKPVLVCDLLTATPVPGTPRTYSLVAKAHGSNTTITGYTFSFNDGSNVYTAKTSANSVTATHTFPADNTSYTVKVAVNSTDLSGVTSAGCATVIKTPAAPVKPALVCTSLTYAQDGLKFSFTANAVATKTTITSYVFYFGDGKSMEVKTSAAKANAAYTYAENNKTYVAYVAVNSSDIKNVTSATCKINVTTPKPNECKPGIPAGDSRCTECKPGIPAGDSRCETPTTLVNTGAGSVAGLFAGTSVLGALGHRFFLKRRMAR